ncbi:FAD-dependent oxidoreductase [Bradyrhizobium sp. STM 3809]|uniref:FAD-dependent oxidoreductase n=1 Tax=Bradyrhizobium sp. STM 3809 TaxID=551936 RepID=UPI0002405A35|nr:fragment of putative Monomeric sarcosine oxidase (MSOX) (part 1) [Bradyrhizobium sp. STM 3809]
MPQFDVIVIGCGAVGSAALLHLAKAGKRVLGIDRFQPPHTFGSTHGETRITRAAIGEGVDYTPLAQRSHAIWRELERDTAAHLFEQCGCLFIPARDGGEVHGVSSAVLHQHRDGGTPARRRRRDDLVGTAARGPSGLRHRGR